MKKKQTKCDKLTQLLRKSTLCAFIETLGLSKRTIRALRILNIEYVEDLITFTPKQLIDINNFGKKSLSDIKQALDVYGLRLSMSKEDIDNYTVTYEIGVLSVIKKIASPFLKFSTNYDIEKEIDKLEEGVFTCFADRDLLLIVLLLLKRTLKASYDLANHWDITFSALRKELREAHDNKKTDIAFEAANLLQKAFGYICGKGEGE